MYEIQSKGDFRAGTTLIVRIPEEALDKKALYTISSDMPSFILPFSSRTIDNQIELTYRIENRTKLTYLSGNRSPKEYADLWISLIQPLLDCSDWFMNPYSFVFEPEHLYCDKNGKIISYVYIPSMQSCSSLDSLKDMITKVALNNRVSDINLENNVLFAIQDFNPNEFLNMIKPYSVQAVTETAATAEPSSWRHTITAELQAQVHQPLHTSNKQEESCSETGSPNESDDIIIDLSSKGKALLKKKSKGFFFSTKTDNDTAKEATPKKTGIKRPFWKRKINDQNIQQEEIVLGAAAAPDSRSQETVKTNSASPLHPLPPDIDDDKTQIMPNESGTAKFRYIGNGDHPRSIDVCVAEGKVFTIGRFDALIGTKQSNFEFDNKTVAISRRHAAVERSADEYKLVDLSSTAGTFLNGERLPSNVPTPLERGCRVSFGHLGADYVWED